MRRCVALGVMPLLGEMRARATFELAAGVEREAVSVSVESFAGWRGVKSPLCIPRSAQSEMRRSLERALLLSDSRTSKLLFG